MRDIEVLNNHPEQAPENLVAFVDGRTVSSPEFSEPEPERPRKKRKLAGPNSTSKTPPSGEYDDQLTLARVDISLVRFY